MFVPNDPLYDTLQWNLPLIEPGTRVGHPAGGRVDDHRRGARHAASPIPNATITATIPRVFDDDGNVLYPALGRVTIRYSAAPQVVALADLGRFVAPRDFIWDDDDPLDFDGHGTHVSGTDRSAHEQRLTVRRYRQRWHGWRRVQRQADAGQGDRQPMGLSSSARRTTAPTTSSRAASGMRRTTARKSINMSIGRDGPPGAGRSRMRSGTPSARACSSRSPPATGSRTATRSR